ncbi:hypothetical protein Acr_00g0012910 [Actinidia rufa]|uniref:Uncharacterized protein n=1 Tax=Actinidia rufa TaxID=165716 RepID=A0A7J0D9W0_9ERIC|nr:hypothetical protein Acr_00g0012910 [Actinidia rufa]
MEYNKGDNEGTNDKDGDVPQVGTEEGESRQSEMIFRNVEEDQCKEVRHPSHCGEGHCDGHLEGHSTYTYKGKEDLSKRQGVHGDGRPAKKVKGIHDAPLTSPKKKSPTKKSGIPLPAPVANERVILAQPTTTSACSNGGDSTGLGASAIKDTAVVIKLAQSSLLPADVEMVNKMELDEVAAKFYHLNAQVNKSKHLYFPSIFFGLMFHLEALFCMRLFWGPPWSGKLGKYKKVWSLGKSPSRP